jgi:hypothetical protein
MKKIKPATMKKNIRENPYSALTGRVLKLSTAMIFIITREKTLRVLPLVIGKAIKIPFQGKENKRLYYLILNQEALCFCIFKNYRRLVPV